MPLTHGFPIITVDFTSIRAGNFTLQLYHARPVRFMVGVETNRCAWQASTSSHTK